MNQNTLRQTILNQRNTLTQAQCLASGQALLRHLIDAALITKPNMKLGIYLSMSGEISLQPMIDFCWQNNVNCYAPILQRSPKGTLVFSELKQATTCEKNQYGILEPVTTEASLTMPNELDIVFCPLVAFDLNGHRIGMGKGYYDKTFAFRRHEVSKPLLIGCAHAFQQVHTIEPSVWDVTLDGIVTDENMFFPKRLPSC